MTLAQIDWAPVLLTLELASVTTVFLLLLGTPLAWWLTRTGSRWKPAVESLVALPLVLPPTVLGFYLLIVLGPQGLIGGPWRELTGSALTFSFSGLVVASVLYSLPFVVQPLHSAFAGVDYKFLEAAQCMRATRSDAFFSVVLPLAVRGYVTGAVLGFAHTLGEFGVVLMVGGNIPGKTQVLSISIYDHVESGLMIFSFLVLLVVYTLNRRYPLHML